jgi:hypothetical protein
MDVKEAVLAGLKELIVPELQVMRQAQAEVKTILTLTNKRLDDMNAHLVDQSRRLDETNKRIDKVNADLILRIDKVNADLILRIDKVNADLNLRIDKVNADLILRIDEINRGVSRLYEVIVRREEHTFLTERVARLEQAVEDMKRHLAA